MKRVLILGGGGFIGANLVKRLKTVDTYVVAIDCKAESNLFEPSAADEYISADLRYLSPSDTLFVDFDEIYQLAADMGGAGYLFTGKHDANVMRNSVQINLNILEAVRIKPGPKLFFASSACVYPSLEITDSEACVEDDAYPAIPDSEYGWEKLFSERLYLSYAKQYGIPVRIARFHNVFGPLSPYTGGKEKAPAALIRKTILAQNGTSIDIWGDGSATRSFMYVDDVVEGVVRLMASDFQGPVNIGSSRVISIADLAQMIATIGGKMLTINPIEGPIGVQGRNSDNTLIREKLGWEPVYPLEMGLVHTYRWIAEQMKVVRPDGKPVDIFAGSV